MILSKRFCELVPNVCGKLRDGHRPPATFESGVCYLPTDHGFIVYSNENRLISCGQRVMFIASIEQVWPDR